MSNSNPHRWIKVKFMSWPMCCKCGLVALRNEATRWCSQNGCDYDEHPDYKRISKTWGPLKAS